MSGSQHETALDLWPQKMFLQKKKEEGIKITNGWTRWRRSKLIVNRYSSQTTHESIGILYHDKAEICFPTWMIPGLKPTRSRPPLPNTQPVSSSPPCLCPLPQHPLHLLTQAVSKVPHEVQVTQELHLLLAQRIPTGAEVQHAKSITCSLSQMSWGGVGGLDEAIRCSWRLCPGGCVSSAYSGFHNSSWSKAQEDNMELQERHRWENTS